jgi:hypothetical protein
MIEVMVAAALLGMGLAGVYQVITISMQMRKHAYDYYIGTVVANNRLEQAQGIPFGELTLLEEERMRIDETGSVSEEGRFYRTTTVTTPWDGSEQLAMIEVRVEVPHPRRLADSGRETMVAVVLYNNED